MTPTPTDVVRQRLEQTGSAIRNDRGHDFMAQCPAHEDRTPSLHVSTGDDGKTLIKCHGHCDTDNVLAALKLQRRDLFVPKPTNGHLPPVSRLRRPDRQDATYTYTDADGTVLYRVRRYGDKRFTQEHPDGAGGWAAGRGRDPVLYRLADLAARPDDPVWIVEGEKDADRLAATGRLATTSGAAGSWRDQHTAELRGRHVAILADNDQPGREHAVEVANALHGVAASVRLVDLPGLPPKGDVSDWLDAGHTIDELAALAQTTDVWDGTPPAPVDDLPEPLDLAALMTGDPPEIEWVVEPIAARGKLVGIVAKRGEGKSLLTLDLAAAAATGTAKIDQPDGPPLHVVYLDMEMGPDDLYARLADLGYTPDHPRFARLVDHLHYYQLPALPPLDTEAGGEMLERIAARHDAALVVIDTVSRVISGGENDAEPFLELFRHTETRLKRAGIGMLRLDHFGKDATKGSRGHSAKEDPLDVVWNMAVGGDTVTLRRTKGRQAGTPDTVTLVRDDSTGRLEHRQPDRVPIGGKAAEVVRVLNRLGVPDDASVRAAQEALREAGEGRGRAAIVEAVRWRKNAAEAVRNRSGEPEARTVPGTGPEPPRTAQNTPSEPPVPPIGGTGGRGPVSGVVPL